MSRQSSVRRHDPIKTDRFPLLDISELSVCLKSCQLNAPEEDLYKPTPIFVQSLFQQIIQIFLCISPNRIRYRQQRALEEDERDEFEESLNLLSLQTILYKFFVDCGVYDFMVTDLTKPEPHRIKRLLSAVVNFARFREEHVLDHEAIMQENNLKFDKFQTILKENKILNKDIHFLQTKNNKINENLDKLNQHNYKVEQELRNLKKIQESLTTEHLNYKTEKSRLIQALEDHNYLLLESKKDLEKMKNYIVESPEIITKIIEDMKNSLKTDQEALNNLELRSKNLAISIESFTIIQVDLKHCLKLVEELNNELNKKSINQHKLNQYKEKRYEFDIKLNELDRNIQILKRQINNIEEKTIKTTNQKDEKTKEYEIKMQELHKIYATLMIEKNLNENDVQKKKSYINSIQKKMNDLEISFKKEYDETTLEIQRLNSHFKIYLNQIEEKLNL